MSDMINMFEKRSLTNALEQKIVLEPWLFNLVFSGQKEFHVTDTVDIEIYTNTTKLAQFVSPTEKALAIKKGSRRIETIHIPRTWEKKVFTTEELLRYQQLGEIWVSNAAQRTDAANTMILQELEDLKNRIYNRLEQLTCEALSTGEIHINQDNIEFALKYGFINTVNLKTLLGAALWSASTSNPLKDIRTWRGQMMKTSGRQATHLILGSDAAAAFVDNVAVMKALNNLNYKVGTMDMNQSPTNGGIFIGSLAGVQVYEYNQQYMTNAGVLTDMIPTTGAILLAVGHPGFRTHYGAMARIMNSKVQLIGGEMYIETDTNDDKTVLEWKIEQKSMVAIHEPNAVISATVV